MVNSKVIDMSDVMNSGGMAARIAQAKEKAEAEYQEKIKQSREADVDVRDFFSDEELDTGSISTSTTSMLFAFIHRAAKDTFSCRCTFDRSATLPLKNSLSVRILSSSSSEKKSRTSPSASRDCLIFS